MRRPIGILVSVALVVLGLAACSPDGTLTEPRLGDRPLAASTPPGGGLGGPGQTLTGRYVAITAGDDFTCVLTNTHTVYCWGRSDSAQAGRFTGTICNGVLACIARPTIVLTSAHDTLFASSIDAGAAHACAIDLQNRAWCWGSAGSGQVGLNFGAGPTEAIQVPGTTGITFYQISAGRTSTCAQANTGLLCWGELPLGVMSAVHWISADPSYTTISVGGEHLCALKVLGYNQNAVDCAGLNDKGQLTDSATVGTLTNLAFPFRTRFGTAVWRVSAGDEYTCAEMINGTIQCAGNNKAGQLARGTIGGFLWAPALVGNGQLLHAVTTGKDHACALDASSRAWCWGNSDWGQVGNDPNNQITGTFTTPQLVSGGHVFFALAAGKQHTCGINYNALTRVSQILCWGINHLGQLGLGTTVSWFSTPVQAINP